MFIVAAFSDPTKDNFKKENGIEDDSVGQQYIYGLVSDYSLLPSLSDCLRALLTLHVKAAGLDDPFQFDFYISSSIKHLYFQRKIPGLLFRLL